MKGTHVIAAALTCMACASTVAAQAPEPAQAPGYFRARQQDLREQRATAKAEAEALKQAAAQARGRGARGGQRAAQAEASETFTRTVRLERGGTLDLQNGAGDVTITGGDGREATIEVVKQARALNDERARLVLTRTRVDIAERGGNIEVRTVPAGGPGQVRVNYVITLPENANVVLRSASGNLRVQKMSGDGLNVDAVQSNVIVSDSQIRMVELHTVLGDMALRNITARRAFVQSMQGNLEYAGPLQRTGQYRLQNHTGNIRVIPSGGIGFDLDAMTNRGDLQSDFVLKLPRPVQRRPAPLKILRGPVGDAGAMLSAYSFAGDILIVKPEGAQ